VREWERYDLSGLSHTYIILLIKWIYHRILWAHRYTIRRSAPKKDEKKDEILFFVPPITLSYYALHTTHMLQYISYCPKELTKHIGYRYGHNWPRCAAATPSPITLVYARSTVNKGVLFRPSKKDENFLLAFYMLFWRPLSNRGGM